MSRGTLDAINRLTGVLFFGAIILGITVGHEHRLVTHIISIGLVVVGTPMFIYGLTNAGKHKTVFDYEPTVFWGKQSNGKTAREILMTFNTVGLWCALTGIALLLVV